MRPQRSIHGVEIIGHNKAGSLANVSFRASFVQALKRRTTCHRQHNAIARARFGYAEADRGPKPLVFHSAIVRHFLSNSLVGARPACLSASGSLKHPRTKTRQLSARQTPRYGLIRIREHDAGR